MITTVTGYFKSFDLEVETNGDDFNTASNLLFTAEINSVDTNNAQRDGHLKSDDFFNADKFPTLSFKGKKYEGKGESAKLTGDLTIRDVTKSITLDVEFGGIATDPWGQTKAGFTVSGKISRKEFNLLWNAVTEAGSVVVSDDVKIHAEIQLIKQA